MGVPNRTPAPNEYWAMTSDLLGQSGHQGRDGCDEVVVGIRVTGHGAVVDGTDQPGLDHAGQLPRGPGRTRGNGRGLGWGQGHFGGLRGSQRRWRRPNGGGGRGIAHRRSSPSGGVYVVSGRALCALWENRDKTKL